MGLIDETCRGESGDEKKCRAALMEGAKIFFLWRGFFINPSAENG